MELNRRRITNGLAWAGAALIVAIPTADLIARQFAPADEPQVAIVQEAPVVETAAPPETTSPEPTAPSQPAPTPDPVNTAAAAGTGDAVDTFLQSGRDLPSYISGGNAPRAPADPAPAPRPAASQPAPVASPQTQPAAQPTRPVIATPRPVTGFPTPASERPTIAVAPTPAPVVQPVVPPLIIDRPPVVNSAGPVVTAQDLEDWETGPLSDFLANRGGQRSDAVPGDYEPGGFWLDEGPRSGNPRRLPPAYDDGYYYPSGQ